MKRLVITLAGLGLAASLAACSQKEEPAAQAAAAPEAAPAAAATTATPAAPSSEMAGMKMAPGAKMAKGSGTVTAVSAGSVTIDHGPIPEAGWGAMTMAFKAAPGVASQVKAGDKVAFDLKLEGSSNEITAIRKQ
jgi:Cu(I)/Ag(I) efflux system protein CusF